MPIPQGSSRDFRDPGEAFELAVRLALPRRATLRDHARRAFWNTVCHVRKKTYFIIGERRPMRERRPWKALARHSRNAEREIGHYPWFHVENPLDVSGPAQPSAGQTLKWPGNPPCENVREWRHDRT